MPPTNLVSPSRRSVLRWSLAGALPALAACGTPLPLAQRPPAGGVAAAGAARLAESAQAHGAAAYLALNDINVAYAGAWLPFIDKIQPLVVDKGYRGSSQERLLPRLGVNAQAYRGAAGSKHVFWQRGTRLPDGKASEIAVWFNGQRSADDAVQAAAAVVAECYGLFLLGPLWLDGRGLPCELSGTERVNGRLCDVVHVWLRPGLGRSELDRVSLCIDRDDAVMRRVRFTLEGYAGTQGAVAETDTFEHQRRHGVLWPMRSREEVVHPLRIPAHDWAITGLDVDRGCTPADLRGPQFSGVAAAPARPV